MEQNEHTAKLQKLKHYIDFCVGSIVELHGAWASIVRTSAELLKGRDTHGHDQLSLESLIELNKKSVIRGEPPSKFLALRPLLDGRSAIRTLNATFRPGNL